MLFRSVNAGPLGESWRVDRGQPAYGAKGDADEIAALLAQATRNA